MEFAPGPWKWNTKGLIARNNLVDANGNSVVGFWWGGDMGRIDDYAIYEGLPRWVLLDSRD